jgi:hypothetical protein
MNYETARSFAAHIVDTSLSGRLRGSDQHAVVRDGSEHEHRSVLVGWQFGPRPFVVAVHCAYGHFVAEEEAIELATEYALEQDWFGSSTAPEPDYVLS